MKVRKSKKIGYDVCKMAVEKHLEDFTKVLEEASEDDSKSDSDISLMIHSFYHQSIGYSFACLELKVITYDEAKELQKIALKWYIDNTSDFDNGFCSYYKDNKSCSGCPYQLEEWQKEFIEGEDFSPWCQKFDSIPLFLF